MLGERLNAIAADFNASQTAYKVVPVFKGSYAETMTAAVAAFRAGNPPDIVQVIEVGTATMMAAKGAIKPVHQLMQESGVAFDPNAYLPAVTSYYSTADGKMLSLPFNSSTPVMYWNKEAFKKAGSTPRSRRDLARDIRGGEEAARRRRDLRLYRVLGQLDPDREFQRLAQFAAGEPVERSRRPRCGARIKQSERRSSRHNLAEAEKEKSFSYGGRTTEPDAKFRQRRVRPDAELVGGLRRLEARRQFEFGVTELPYYPDIAGAPQNTIIGGASLWVMGGKKPEQYKGVAQFFAYLSKSDVQQKWHEETGYLPITKAAYVATKASGFYAKNPGTEVAIVQMTKKPPTPNSRACGSAIWCRSVTSSPRIWRLLSPARARRKPRSTTPSPAATPRCAVPKEYPVGCRRIAEADAAARELYPTPTLPTSGGGQGGGKAAFFLRPCHMI